MGHVAASKYNMAHVLNGQVADSQWATDTTRSDDCRARDPMTLEAVDLIHALARRCVVCAKN